jgi:2-polyprenyl-3-methyl-5-hydroxy-6-metoxy-1,4-benzoquinol methylase
MVWGEIWKSVEGAAFEGETYRWFFYKRLLGDYDFRRKRVLEIGCGTGMNSILMAKAGARVTFLDNSQEALDIVSRNLDKFGLKGELVCQNAFHHGFEGEFDLVHSEGVIEHFREEYRQGILDAHSKALKKGGRVVILVPNMKCPPYRLGKFLAERTGTWIYGNEYPYTKKELQYRMNKAGLDVLRLQGAEAAFSFGWLFSPFWQKSPTIMKKAVGGSADRRLARLNYGGNFLNRWGVILGACGTKT